MNSIVFLDKFGNTISDLSSQVKSMTTLAQNTPIKPQIEESWKEVLKDEFRQEYFTKLKEFLVEEKKKNVVYPPGSMIFNAFNINCLCTIYDDQNNCVEIIRKMP